MEAEAPTPAEIFNAALEFYEQGEVEEAVTCLRAGFFENLYIAPVLLEEPYEPQAIWYPSADAEPAAANEYRDRYGRLWTERDGALGFLRGVWSDPLVRSEIRSFVSLSKAILQNLNAAQQAELGRERRRFGDLRRIRRTQSELIARLAGASWRRPPAPPRIGLILLAARDPRAAVDFYRALFRMEPVQTSRLSGGCAEFELPGVRLAIHGRDRLAEGDPYRLGPPPESLGWGAIITVCVPDLDRCYENALEAGIEVVDADLGSSGRRFFVVKDPSGYVLEVSEEREPRGF